MMKENIEKNINHTPSFVSLKCIGRNNNESSLNPTPPSSRYYRKKFKIESSSKILSCRQINQQFS